MRNLRDAKAMAQSLREAMGAKKIPLTHSEALELVSTMFGFADWNTLSAYIHKNQENKAEARSPHLGDMILPVVPMRDLVPFPTMQMLPLWIRRKKNNSSSCQCILAAQGSCGGGAKERNNRRARRG